MPKAVRSFLDYDYLDQLSDKDLAWLKQFSNKYYRAQFNVGETTPEWDKEERRKTYSRKNAACRDLYTKSVDLFGDSLEHILGTDEK